MDFARSAKYILSALVLFSGVLMGSCTGEGKETQAVDMVQVEKASYEVSFVADGLEISYQIVSEDEFAQVPEAPEKEGARFGYWMDSHGRKSQPAATPVKSGESYTAVYFPLLDKEAPYLFTGSGDLLNPDGVIVAAELETALNALTNEEGRSYFPESLAASDDITVQELRAVLLSFFTSDELDRVILGRAADEKVSRSQFAVILNSLLGREYDGKVIPADGSYCIPDLTKQRADYSHLMEATVAHTHSDDGAAWLDTTLPAMYDEGFVLVEGNLYCVDSEGYFLCDTVLGTLTFGYNGRYTSGNAALDGYVSAALADITEAKGYSDSLEMLRAAYDYCCESFGIQRRNIYPMGARGWEISEADTMFEAGTGNSASYAAVFWALARGLGYEATAVSGVIGQNQLPHAWVEIEIDGVNYFFDPGAESGALEDADMSRDRFMMSSNTARNLRYVTE